MLLRILLRMILRVARSRFELLSRDPESPMIDRYTTGLIPSSCTLEKG